MLLLKHACCSLQHVQETENHTGWLLIFRWWIRAAKFRICVYVDTHVCAGTHVCVGQKSTLAIIPQMLSTLFLGTRPLVGLEHALIWVSSQSSETQHWDYLCEWPCLAFHTCSAGHTRVPMPARLALFWPSRLPACKWQNFSKRPYFPSWTQSDPQPDFLLGSVHTVPLSLGLGEHTITTTCRGAQPSRTAR